MAGSPTSKATRPRLGALVGLATILVALAAAVPQASGATAPRARTVTKWTLAPGVVLQKIHYTTGPKQLRALIVTAQGNAATLDLVMASDAFPALALTSTMASRPSVGAVAAINGDFAVSGQPVHSTAMDADLITSGIQSGTAFAITKEEDRAYAKRPHVAITSVVSASGATWPVDKWNAGAPGGSQIAGYTSAGGTIEKPPDDPSCSVRLTPIAGSRLFDDPAQGVSRSYTVAAGPVCEATGSLGMGSAAGNVVLAADRGTAKADQISAIPRSSTVTLTWSLGWKHVLDAVGGQPLLLEDPDGDGVPANVAPAPPCGSYFCHANPRTGIGITKGCEDTATSTACKVILLTVDGRQSGWSVGENLVEFANEFKDLGAVYAVNLDGGGGTTMWIADRSNPACESFPGVGGCLVNRPSDVGGERHVGNSVVVLPGADGGEPLFSAVTSLEGPPAATDPTDAITDPGASLPEETDPASTGGLFDAIAAGGLGPIPANLSPEFRQVLAMYRSTIAGSTQ